MRRAGVAEALIVYQRVSASKLKPDAGGEGDGSAPRAWSLVGARHALSALQRGHVQRTCLARSS